MYGRMGDFEITALVLSEHEAFRRSFAALEETNDLTAAWQDLAARLEVHAVAEEELLYPVLAGATPRGAAEGVDAVRDHNGIRHAVQAVGRQQVDSETWWQAVRAVQEENAEHMAEEEREVVPHFRRGVDEARREELGMRWLQFHDEHQDARGLPGDDANPEEVVRAEPGRNP